MNVRKVLVVYKKSSYELYGKIKKDNHFLSLIKKKDPTVRRFLPSHDIHQNSMEVVQKTLQKMKIASLWVYRAHTFSEKGFDLVISIGGDGTFLEASHSVFNVPMLGVNSNAKDSVGMFCGLTAESFAEGFEKILQGKSKPIEMTRLQVTLGGKKIAMPVLNDILITNSTPAATSRLVLRYQKQVNEMKCSGVWVSPAAGSTAGTRSAGGKVLPISSRHFQCVVREPYFSPEQEVKKMSIILKPQEKLTIYSKMRTGGLYFDGSHESLPFPIGVKASIQVDKKPLRVYGYNLVRRALFR